MNRRKFRFPCQVLVTEGGFRPTRSPIFDSASQYAADRPETTLVRKQTPISLTVTKMLCHIINYLFPCLYVRYINLINLHLIRNYTRSSADADNRLDALLESAPLPWSLRSTKSSNNFSPQRNYSGASTFSIYIPHC